MKKEATYDGAPGADVERTSGVLVISGIPHPYFLEGKGVPCVVVFGPYYQPLFSDEL